MIKEDIKNFSLDELKSRMKSLHLEPYRAEQIFEWIYQKGASSFGEMTDLPMALRDLLTDKFRVFTSEVIKKQISKIDGTAKYLFSLDDKETVEAVLIPAKGRLTVCLSSQVGCAFECKFCASGLMGFKRNLSCGEILEQALVVSKDAGIKGSDSSLHRVTNIVLMGTGEPLMNYDNLIKAIGVLNSPYGLAIGARKITVSSAGYIPGIKRFMSEKAQFELSISLHAATDHTRSYLMPINKKYPLSELMEICREYVEEKNRIITFEYVLIKGINDSCKDAEDLSKLLKGLSCKVNLIPYNSLGESSPVPGSSSIICHLSSPSGKEVREFQKILSWHNINSTVRAPRGADIDAACGQLRIKSDRDIP